MHWSLGNVQRGILGGYATSVILALAGAVNGDVSWQKTLGAILLITGPVVGALIDPGSKPAKADQPK